MNTSTLPTTLAAMIADAAMNRPKGDIIALTATEAAAFGFNESFEVNISAPGHDKRPVLAAWSADESLNDCPGGHYCMYLI